MTTNTIQKEHLNEFLTARIQQSERLVIQQVSELKTLVDGLAEHVLSAHPILPGDDPRINALTVRHWSACIAPIVDNLREQAGALVAKHEILRSLNPTND